MSGPGRRRMGAWVGAIALASGCAHEPAAGRAWVRDVTFHGNHAFSKGDILDRVSLSETSWVPFSPKRYFDPLTMSVDRRRIVALYRAHGYFAARVTDVRVTPEGDSVRVDITVDEGPPVRIAAVRIDGLDALPAEARREVTEKLPIAPGPIYDEANYLAAKGLVEARLRAQGRAFARVEGEALVDRDALRATIVFRVTPGEVVRYGHIAVEGTDRGREVVVRSGLSSGRRYDPVDIDAARARLNAVGLFSAVTVALAPRPGAPTIADVTIRVTPGPRNDVRAGVGVLFDGFRSMVSLPVTYTRYGFFGGLRSLRVRAQPGWVAVPNFWNPRTQGPGILSDVTLTQPDFLARDLSLRVAAGYDRSVDYAFTWFGPNVLVGLQYELWRGRLAFGLSYNFQFLRFTNLAAPDVFNDPFLARAFLGFTNPYRLGFLMQSVVLDLRDDPLNPRRGAFFSLNLEEGETWLGSAFRYEKLTPDVRFYVPLWNRVVLAQRVQYGRMFGHGEDASPVTRRYYAGGANSHRGFGFARLSPEVVGSDGQLVPIGGDQLFLSQTDLRFDVVRVRGSWLGLGVFFDAGDVPGRGRSIDFGNLNLAVGGGLRYHTPVGVVRVDVGVRLNRLSPFEPDGRENPDPGRRVAYHLMIGEPF